MKLIIETFVTVIFLSLTVIIAAQIISSQVAINGATTFHTNAVQVIEESNFDNTVIAMCKEEAIANGYVLDVSVEKETKLVCSACNTMWEVSETIICPTCESTSSYVKQVTSEGLISLTYDVSVPILGIEKEGTLQSNAR